MNTPLKNVRIVNNNKKRPYVNNEALRFPQPFMKLAPDQQRDALTQLGELPSNIQQAVLDEWAVRCCSGLIRNPAGYLFGLLRKARLGEFRASVTQVVPVPADSVPAANTVIRSKPVSREVAQAHIEAIRQRFGLRQKKP